MSTNEIAHARTQLEEITREFREKIALWAAVCYESPNTNAGLDYFRENLNEFLPTLHNQTMQSAILENISILTKEKSETVLLIAQTPIHEIWRYFFDISSINEDEYNELLQIKKDQFPKYEGRWPVIFASFVDDHITAESEEPNPTYSRKSISVD